MAPVFAVERFAADQRSIAPANSNDLDSWPILNHAVSAIRNIRAFAMLDFLWFGLAAGYVIVAIFMLYMTGREISSSEGKSLLSRGLGVGMCLFWPIALLATMTAALLRPATFAPAEKD